jgi:transposase IS66 family protein
MDAPNTSQPPSSAPPVTHRPPRRRTPSGRQPGGQPGHPGQTRAVGPPPRPQGTDRPPVPGVWSHDARHRPHWGAGWALWGHAGPRSSPCGREPITCRNAPRRLSWQTWGGSRCVWAPWPTWSTLRCRPGRPQGPTPSGTSGRRRACLSTRRGGATGVPAVGVAVAAWVPVFVVRLSRGATGAQELLGDRCGGILVTDRWSAYLWYPTRWRPGCGAHLRRDVEAMLARGGPSQALGTAWRAQGRQVVQAW